MKIKHAFATGLLALTPALTGCLSHTHSVIKTRLPDIVQNATIEQLLQQTNDRNNTIRNMTLSVKIATSTGGGNEGSVTDHHSFDGYIVIAQPEQIRVFGLVPVLHTKIMDMVSDGKSFKMLIPPENCAIVGSDVVTSSAQKGLYALRPSVILDPLLIQGPKSDQLVSMTQDSRPGYPDPKKRKQLIVEPDYDIEFLSQPQGQFAHSLRVIHIGRSDLMPWRQDIYNAEGKIETQAFYTNYRPFGDIVFPTKIVIQRPLDELSLTITVTRATFNQELASDAFKLEIPDGTVTTNMDDPVSAAIAPCKAHATQ